MKLKTIDAVIDLLKAWALDHSMDIIELNLVGSQADVIEYDSPLQRSDVDFVVIIKNDVNPTVLFSELAVMGLQQAILFHPLIMTKDEQNEKLRIHQYRSMLCSGIRIYPEK